MNKKYKIYSENINDNLHYNIINNYQNKNKGIIGIFIFLKRINIITRSINNNCVICGSYNDIVCYHKNDL